MACCNSVVTNVTNPSGISDQNYVTKIGKKNIVHEKKPFLTKVEG